MARLASRVPDVVPLTAAERRLAAWLRFFAAIFAAGAVIFFVRPAGTVADLDRVGLLLGLTPLPPAGGPVAADFWLTLAVANMAAIATCAGLAAADVRRRRTRLPVPRGAARRPADRARARGSAPRGEAARAVSTRDELLRILVRRSYLREPGKQFRLASGRLSDY